MKVRDVWYVCMSAKHARSVYVCVRVREMQGCVHMSAVACARDGKKEGEDPKGDEVNSAINQERMGVCSLCTCVVSEAKRFSISTDSSALAAGEQERKYESQSVCLSIRFSFVFWFCSCSI